MIFHYSAVPVGTTVKFTMSASFGQGRQEGDSFANTIYLYQEGEETLSTTADTVTLSLTSNFYFLKYADNETAPDVGDSFPMRLVLRNAGDGGATISNVLITDPLPSGLVADTSTPVTGYDTSTTFPDTSQDGKTGTWANSILYFPLDSYSGTEYTITMMVQVDSRTTAGTEIENVATWSMDDVIQGEAFASLTTYEAKVDATLWSNTPENGTIGESLQDVIYYQNSGTVPITDFVLTVTLDENYTLEQLRSYYVADTMTSYDLYITTTQDPKVEILVAEKISDTSYGVDLSSYLAEDAKVQTVILKSDQVLTSTDSSALYLYGTIDQDTALDSTLTFTSTIQGTSTLGDLSVDSNSETLVDNRSVVQSYKQIMEEKTAYYPLDEITFGLFLNAYTFQSVSPIFADLLPKELAYVPDSAYYVYYDALTAVTYDSRQDDFPITLPKTTITENYDGKDSTLLRFSFSDFTLNLGDSLNLYFTAMVKIGATEFTNLAYLGNPTDNAIVFGSSYVDVLDMDGDGYTEETIAMSEPVSGVVLYNSEFSLEKWVEGNLDTEVSKEGTATAGGEVTYCLEVTNNQEATLSHIDLVEILPHVGDTGVILVNTPRESAFALTLSQIPTAKVTNILTGEEQKTEITVEYSLSTDPIRFSSDGSTTGTGEWLSQAPEDLSTVAALRIYTADDLEAYHQLKVTLLCTTPVAVPVGEVAYNSFAVEGEVVQDQEVSSLLPTEPAKVSVTIASSALGSIGDFVWNDSSKDGIYDKGEEGVNGVTVELYDEKGTLLATTVTAEDFYGNAGYYRFGELEAGNYQLKFIPTGEEQLTVQNLESEMGSRPDPSTGFTEIFALAQGEAINDMDAGVYMETSDPLEQAISDLITSIALEEMGIQAILNAEGAKIQKALALDLSLEELLAVNDSVASMVQEITALEKLLSEKLTYVSQ
ncbi:MAG: SdrD B-like domain-containing protein [Eubacteriales bacterium]